jgi:uncharacterized membrane protein
MSYLKAAGLGVVAGMRSMTAPALISHELARTHDASVEQSSLRFLCTSEAAAAFKVLAAGEVAADKTPWIPDRTSPVGLIGRGLSGALVGAALCTGNECLPEAGAAIGALSALAAAFAAYHLRKRLGRELRVPDPVIGVLEDAAAAGFGLLILRSGNEP